MSRWRILWLLVMAALLAPSEAARAQAPEGQDEVVPAPSDGETEAQVEADDELTGEADSPPASPPSSSDVDPETLPVDSEPAVPPEGAAPDAAEAGSGTGAETAEMGTCRSAASCLPPEHSTIFRLSVGGGLRHDEIEGLAGASLDLGLRPLYGMLLMSLSFSGATNAALQIVSVGVLVDFDLSHFFASDAFTWQPDRDRWWGLSIGGRLGFSYSVLREQLFEGLEPAEFRLMRPEVMLMAEFRFRPWEREALGTRLLVRLEHHLSIGGKPSRTILLLGVSQEFSL